MKIFFRCIGNTVLGLMLVTALVLLIPGLFGIRPYVVYSGSMEPEIPTGAVVFTKEGEFSPKKGDIITFHNGDTVVTHRVVKKEKDIFITKGDANKTEDPKTLLVYRQERPLSVHHKCTAAVCGSNKPPARRFRQPGLPPS